MIGRGRLRGAFITATGTGVGKTFVTRGLARAILRRGRSVAALKPVETGCVPTPADAMAIAQACRRPELAHVSGFYRAAAPLAPLAATLGGETPPPDVRALAASVEDAGRACDVTLVEGAGGLFVPLSAEHTLADLAAALRLPVLIVAPDALGVLSHVHALILAARGNALPLHLAAIVLVRHPTALGDASRRWNGHILSAFGLPVLLFEDAPDLDDALADVADRSGLTDTCLTLFSNRED